MDEMHEQNLIKFDALYSGLKAKNGPKYKSFMLMEGNVQLINVDLFLVTPPAEWGVQMVIRTGPAEFSHWIVTREHFGGALPNDARVKDGAVWVDDKKLEMPEEINLLDFLGLGWIEPGERDARWRR